MFKATGFQDGAALGRQLGKKLGEQLGEITGKYFKNNDLGMP
ncbi:MULTISPECIES: hypothetical protein [Comamonas]|nr:hypothetical protein [Comamonas aquatica]MDE1555468.1 hypothetical protein [Comamonas aquatica]MDH0202588.1 hypothetical protein [Comamonas aquatica]MDH1447690.1 hypothetical protein [Comamonas aquatica]